MLSAVQRFFAPAPHQPRLPDEEVARLYPRLRWSILESTFLGYGTFYLLRNNLSPITKELEGALGYTHNDIGSIVAITAITYGVGKLLMGSLSDRSNVRRFMPFGLLMTAACNFTFGSVASLNVHMALWALNGLFQGMGWAPCGRSVGHWFSVKERGLVFGTWNVSHNIGGGVAGVMAAEAAQYFGGWQYAFFVPGVLSVFMAIYLALRLRDTPQSCGLPPIEEYRQDYPGSERVPTHERELGTRELFVDYILTNKYLWLFALTNFFVYITRYAMLDWGPVYLREVKGATLSGGGLAVLILEFGGIPSTIFLGWVSDRLGGRRGMVALLCMVPVVLAFAGILLNPPGHSWIDLALLTIVGFFVYPALNLIAISGLDLTSKKAVGTAAGFIGMFGYLGRTVEAKGVGWAADHYTALYGQAVAWQIVFSAIIGCGLISIVLLSFAWKVTPRA